jgi:hypothetical protein
MMNSRRLMVPPYRASLPLGTPLCSTTNEESETSKWVTNVIFNVLADVGYYPDTDRDSGLPCGR